jgi:hypothetical protein
MQGIFQEGDYDGNKKRAKKFLGPFGELRVGDSKGNVRVLGDTLTP